MKDYKEMAESVFMRRDEYAVKKSKKTKRTTAVFICCLAAALGIGAMLLERNAPAADSISTAPDNIIATAPPGKIHTANTTPDASPPSRNEQDGTLWLSTEVITQENADANMGVYIPTFLSWHGGFYGCAEIGGAERFAITEDEVWFNSRYCFAIYRLENRTDCFAICINGGMQVYQKLFEVTFELNGISYGIQYSPSAGSEYTAGSEVFSGEGFTVYEALRQGEMKTAEYLVNILPLLKEELPNMFSGDDNYLEAWQIAIPLN